MMTMMTTGPVVKVGRDKLAACMTCPVCNELFTDATTISECLHTFCRKCIYEKINEEELENCPVCNIELGCAPLEKLRADHSLQDLRAKLFPSKRKRDNPTDDLPSASYPAKRKERSLSSLVISEPRASTQPSRMTGRRKNPTRKNLTVRTSSLSVESPVRKEDDSLKNFSSPEAVNKILQNRRQNESSKQQMHDNGVNKAEPYEGKADLWTPLNCLVEAASKTKTSKFNSQENFVSSNFPDTPSNEAHHLKSKVKDNGYKSKANGDEKDSSPAPSVPVRRRRMQGVRQRRPTASDGLNISAQAVVDSNSKSAGRFNPIWFSLIASSNQAGDAPLPQISSCYLRVKDGSLPASFIKKYLAKKLDLASEAEVEIWLRGQPVISTIQLHHLVELWLQTAPSSERIQTSVGSSGKDFMMILSYGRKAYPQ
ncbi:E3 ubiquitin protein ligase DRIP2 isoform X2 [Ziziphus jujuba]|uniref:E3 ubiquitin protein ligase DRIP2 isoform X2 n=1 Tax=Ziziphus jujuba TaxID=326968 RepID=A0A6P3ZSJ8_ZIZJJ|nr:E3 ubiquitin protein ligase DRIP2 isoform X2 [Ziziphus jujuba]